MSDSDEFDEIIDEFLVESHENLDQLDNEFIALEQNPDPDILASIFRTIHTIKGTSGFLGFGELERVTHVGEFLLSKMRDGEIAVTQENTSVLLQMVDAVRHLLTIIQDTGSDVGGPSLDALIAELERLRDGRASEGAVTAPDEPVSDDAAEPAVDQAAEVAVDEVVEAETPVVADIGAGTFGDLVVRSGLVDPESVLAAVAKQEAGDPRHVGELLVAEGKLAPEQVAATLKAQSEQRASTSPTDTSIRVDVSLLDNLMNLVGELVLARNQILQFTQSSGENALTNTSQRLNLITTELQEGVMKTRMQPIDHVWSRFPRVVRDLSVACDKAIDVVMEGKDTELDRTILEAIKDPLTHLVRNSVDHGIETPVERVAAGKAERGQLTLRAYHEGGQVNIEISDDGRGLSAPKISAKAVEKGLLSLTEASQLSSKDCVNLIFEPGFSTAESVSNISGRGVGMDVVKTNIESIGGSIEVQTAAGVGTTFKIKIPLTLAIIPALVVRSGDGRFAIPQVSLLELLRVDLPTDAIDVVGGTPVYRLRGQLLPIVDLGSMFDQDRLTWTDDPTRDSLSIVVVQADGQPFGLVVDEIMDTAEIVVKPLGAVLKPVPVFAGATIMGDGRVALILDIVGIAGRASVFGLGGRVDAVDESLDTSLRRTLLVATIGDREIALLLDLVARLEDITADRVERSGRRAVVQYRGEIMPLVFVDEAIGHPTHREPDAPLAVIVHTEGEHSVGLVVDQIHDIVEQDLDLERLASDPGLLGSTVIDGRVVDIVDGRALIDRALPTRTGATA